MSTGLLNFLGSTLASGGAVPQVVSNANPLPVTISGGLTGLAVAGVQPAGVIATVNPVIVAGVDGTGTIRDLLTDGTGILQVNASIAGGGGVTATQGPGNTANPWTMQGPAALATAASGNPLRSGAVFNTTPPTLVAATISDFQLDGNGNIRAVQVMPGSTGSDGFANTTIGLPYRGNSVGTVVLPGAATYGFNGSTWDRITKPRTAFRLPSAAATNNAANAKATAGTVFFITALVTSNAAAVYLKLFDSAGAPNPAAVNPLYSFGLTFAAGFTGPVQIPLPAQGIYFPTGIGLALVAGAADLDNTAIAAGQVTSLTIGFA